MATPPIERLLARACVDPESGCWRWTGAKNSWGYGKMAVPGKPNAPYIHRVSYEFFVGGIPDGYHVDHVLARGCVHRDCFNPDHLEAVTPGENSRRGSGPSVSALRRAARTHCPAGHPYAGENLYSTPNGSRQCLACKRAQNRQQRIKAKVTEERS